MILVALTMTLTLQVVRVLFPIVYGLGERTSFAGAGGLALLLFAAPVLTPLLRRFVGPRMALGLAVGGLVAGRLAIQLVHPVPIWLATTAVVFALVALALLLEEGITADRFVLGSLLGLSLDTALRTGFLTWDHAWREGSVPILLAALLAVAALLALRAHTAIFVERTVALPGFVLGPFLFLHVMFLQSIAFVGSQSAVSVPAASVIVLVGNALAILAVVWLAGRGTGPGVSTLGGIALVAAAFFVPGVSGAGAVPAVLAGHPLTAAALIAALRAERVPAWEWRRTPGAAAGTLVFGALILAYHLHYDRPLPFRNTLLVPAAAGLLALGAARAVSSRPTGQRSFRLAVLPLLLLTVPAALFPGEPNVVEKRGAATFRLVTYNVHSGVNGDGQLDPEATARTIERQDPDVVVLQETARGWAISGTIDLAEWLSRRLEMPFVYAPAADGQFGNTLLSRLPILDSDTAFLPRGAGPMRRSYVRARIDLGAGRSVTVVGTHLQNRGVETRLRQIEVLLDGWDREPHTVIAGDMNARPRSPEIRTLEDAGLLSVQDLVGDPDRLTAFLPDLDRRIDWIFGTGDLVFSDFVIPESAPHSSGGASDHLPLAVTVSVPSTA